MNADDAWTNQMNEMRTITTTKIKIEMIVTNFILDKLSKNLFVEFLIAVEKQSVYELDLATTTVAYVHAFHDHDVILRISSIFHSELLQFETYSIRYRHCLFNFYTCLFNFGYRHRLFNESCLLSCVFS
jgi:hypothetical protein